MSTMGDKNQTTPLHNFGAKNLWTHELEAGLVDGSLDLVVHSLKGGFHFPSLPSSIAVPFQLIGSKGQSTNVRV